jgi:hypothetical protein
MPGLAAIDADLVRTLTSGSTDKIQVYREQMDLSRFGLMGCSVYDGSEGRDDAGDTFDITAMAMCVSLWFAAFS